MTQTIQDTVARVRVDALGEQLSQIIRELEASAREHPERRDGLAEAAEEIRRLRTRLIGPAR
jgi:hypothetical protein